MFYVHLSLLIAKQTKIGDAHMILKLNFLECKVKFFRFNTFNSLLSYQLWEWPIGQVPDFRRQLHLDFFSLNFSNPTNVSKMAGKGTHPSVQRDWSTSHRRHTSCCTHRWASPFLAWVALFSDCRQSLSRWDLHSNRLCWSCSSLYTCTRSQDRLRLQRHRAVYLC